MLNYSDNTTFFPLLSSEAEKLVSLYLCSLESESSKSESQEYILLITSKVNLEQALGEIPMVREYLDIFPEDILEFPQEREVQLFIDLDLGIGPISIVPYRISSLELVELKKQLEEMVEKKFVRLSVSLWRAPMLFVKMKDISIRLCVDYR